VDDLRRRLIGAWRVKRYDDRDSVDDQWAETYGPDVDGLIMYDASGWLAVNVVARDGRLDSYYGRFEVVDIREEDGDIRGLLNHLIVASSMPELLSSDPARPFRVSGNTLILGDEETWRRICERAA